MEKKVEANAQEIEGLKESLFDFRTNTKKKLDEISKQFDDVIEKISKPMLTTSQGVGLIIAVVGYVVGIMMYTEAIRSDVRVNTVQISNTEDSNKLQVIQNEKILKALDEIKIDVAVLKSENKNKK